MLANQAPFFPHYRKIIPIRANSIPNSITEEEAADLTLSSASGQLDKGAVTEFFRRHLKIS